METHVPLRLLALTLLLGGCVRGGTSSPPAPAQPGGGVPPLEETAGGYVVLESPASFTVMADTLREDPELASLVEPFRDRMGDRIREVIGEAAGPLSKGWPEGTLGNFAADAILWAARARVDGTVDMALANNGGLRVPLPPGPITVGKMFELMPFENMVSVVTLTGAQVEELAQHIALRGGEPVAGLSLRIELEGDARAARDVRVGGEPPDPSRRYRLATSDYIANGGDEFAVLTRALEREDFPLLVRDAFIAYVRELGRLEPRLEGRITGEMRR